MGLSASRTPIDLAGGATFGLCVSAWRVGADIRFESDTGLSLRLNYVGEYGEKIESHTAGVNFHVKF